MNTKVIFTVIFAVVCLQRLIELYISQRNKAYLLAKGGRLHSSMYIWVVKVLQVCWLVSMLGEVWWYERPFIPTLFSIALIATLLGQYLRYLSMKALGKRWTLSIITIPEAPVVNSGIYRYLRHPNWLGVIMEIAAVPLIHGAYLTAIFFSVANAFLLPKRIQAEEQALSQDNNYDDVFDGIPRFIPKSGLTQLANNQR